MFGVGLRQSPCNFAFDAKQTAQGGFDPPRGGEPEAVVAIGLGSAAMAVAGDNTSFTRRPAWAVSWLRTVGCCLSR